VFTPFFNKWDTVSSVAKRGGKWERELERTGRGRREGWMEDMEDKFNETTKPPSSELPKR
jgi:hypothetical protein